MSIRIRSRMAALALFSVVLLASGCAGKDEPAPVDVEKQAFEDLRAAVRDAVYDAAREAEAVRLVDQLERDLEALRGRIADRRATVRALNANYDTPREDFEAYLARVSKEIRENRKIVTKTQQALGRTMNADEYAAIGKAHTKAMQAAVASIQSI